MGRRLPDAGKYRTGLSAVIVTFWRRGRRLRRNSAGTRRGLRLRRRAGVRFEYRAAGSGKLWRVLPQARHDPVGVRNLVAAKPPDIGGAGHLLFERAPVFLRRRRLNGDTAANRKRKAEDNSLCPHFRFLHEAVAWCSPGAFTRLQTNAARQGSGQQNVNRFHTSTKGSPTRLCRSSSPPRSAAQNPLQRTLRILARPYRRPGCRRSQRS